MKVHFLGIGGSGTSAAASIAQAQGYEVTGCDLEPHNEFTAHFDPNILLTGHDPKHLSGVEVLAVTPAIYSLDPHNMELFAAKDKNIKILTWQQFLGEYLTDSMTTITVCGTHGKSTTTAMIATLLEDAGLDPTVELGGIIPKWGTNYRVGKGKYFVVEADEFNDNFLSFKPTISVVTNIEMDHPEYFKDFSAVKQSFAKFLSSTKQTIVANLKDPGVRDVIASVTKQSNPEIATSPSAPRNDRIADYSKHLIDFPLQIPGEFNILNASAVYQVGLLIGIDPQKIKMSLSNFTGLARRFELIGQFNGAQVYSDFGHHPTEIKVTLDALRQKFPEKKLWVIYQPHMFSRTKALFDDFVNVFKGAPVDGIVILDIYPSRELDTGTVNSKQLVKAVARKNVEYSTWEEFKKNYISYFSDKDIIFFMGAGDTDKFAKELVNLPK
ncbi:MAG: UDP-N-acetylmuramate--L-alanine ligase [Candidatus Daviesbacteria bacterium]|nr:UDP-N-acetylmuramate--L-alanine ligase [Candidatus Daviesbacteria bacterium]